MKSPFRQKINFLLEPKAIIFGLALFYYVTNYMIEAELFSKIGPLEVFPRPWISSPFKLLLASLALWLSRSWTYFIAMLISGDVIYSHGYQMLATCSFINNQPIISQSTLSCWWHITVLQSPKLFAQMVIAVLIFSYATVSLLSFIFYRHSGKFRLKLPTVKR
jgi:hypothetical protein